MSDRLQHLLPPEMRKKAEEMAAKLPPVIKPVQDEKPTPELPVSPESWLDGYIRHFRHCYGFSPEINDEMKDAILAFNQKEMKRGICVAGSFGNGKTSMMRVISSMLRGTTSPHFDVYSVRSLAKLYMEIGPSAIKRASTYPACLDDLGSEGIVSYMGNKINLSEQLIMDRYDCGYFTCITSNNDLGELRAHVGPRAFDRIKEMCEIHVFTGKSYRK